jgi:hypothetical protein
MGGGCEEEKSEDEQEKNQLSDEHIHSLANELKPYFSVNGWRAADGIVQFEGSLRTDPTDAIQGINGKVASSSLLAILTEAEQNHVRTTLLPISAEESAHEKPNWWLHGI